LNALLVGPPPWPGAPSPYPYPYPFIELQLVARDGTARWIGASVAHIRRRPLGGVRAVMILRDITAAKEMDELKSALISMVSHELRTPLTSIRALSELLVDHDLPATERREVARHINQESVRLSGLVENILDVARIEAGRMPCHPRPVELAPLARAAVGPFLGPGGGPAPQRTEPRGQLAGMVGIYGHRFTVEVPADLPPLLADPAHLRQVLDNLLSNAVKYTPDGGEIRVEARRSADGRMAEITVADTGPGIPPADQPHLFDRFYRVDSADLRRLGGAGLGLSIARSLVELLKGRIWVQSEAGRGSRFTFTVPLADAAAGVAVDSGG